MIPMEEIRKKSSEFLLKLYYKSKGNVNKFFPVYEIGEELGFDKDLTKEVEEYLKSKEKIEYRAFTDDPKLELGYKISITLEGIRQVEESLK